MSNSPHSHPLSGGIPEPLYRASRIARVLGNPTAYAILAQLAQSPQTPTQLARKVKRPLTTISQTLAKLRAVDVVRYRKSAAGTVYAFKYEKSTTALLIAFAALVKDSFSNVPEQE